MKDSYIICSTALLFCIGFSAIAHESGYIDLTDTLVRERAHQPRTSSGSCTSAVGAPDPPLPEVTVTLLSLDKAIYRIGEEATFEIKIQNTGHVALKVPWTPQLADLEPTDPGLAYDYMDAVVVLTFTDPANRNFALYETLYGADANPGTMRDLLPGQWLTLRGRKSIEPSDPSWGKEQMSESQSVETKVSGYFREDNASYSPEQGGKDSTWCIPLLSTKANELDATLEPRWLKSSSR